MKWLIGAACVAVIAASGVYLAGEYRSHEERSALDASRTAAITAAAKENSEREARYQKIMLDAEISEDKKHITSEECPWAARQVAYQIDTKQEVTRSQKRRVTMCQEAGLVDDGDRVDLASLN